MHEAPIIVESGPRPVAACIWLHGLGADGHDFEPVVRQLRPARPVRFVLPHAPLRPVTVNGGMTMRAWFDIAAPDLMTQVDTAGIEASARAVRALAEAQGLPVLLAGFSQGGLVALHAALGGGEVLGVMALSTWYPLSVPANRLEVFMAHGTEDPVVPQALAQRSAQALTAAGARVDWRTYPMPHAVCPAEIEDLAHWLDRRVEAVDG